MKPERKATRQWLNNALRTPFSQIINEAKLTPRQQKIIDLKYNGSEEMSNYDIAEVTGYSVSTINKEIAIINDKITNALKVF